jgi:DNA-binding transcriptional ArsR family regulator
MVKYWNERRLRRIRERRERREQRAYEEAMAERRNYAPKSDAPDFSLMLDALGDKTNRALVLRLQKGGAMSLSKLIEPFGMTLAAGLKRLHRLERTGIVTTHKRGRIRFCVFNPRSLKSLVSFLESQYLTK